ncbi:response regulator transcription factor [Ideonella livida]|uniref:Response regulator transcription factor n=1 Tax=Ideonella livida TaxID=2707176 RepID=A0A7C9PFQ9_9BURK|nr:response regulator transcription factor [Ideonella livida]NDY90797.1 response regulator transcription factor [Ideonella livida]
MQTTRVLLVDDHAVVRTGYRRLLELEPDLKVVGEHADADDAYRGLQAAAQGQEGPGVDVMVLDLSMPGRSGLDLLRRVQARWEGLKVLVFSMHDSPAMVDQALKAGADGFVGKSSEPEELIHAVREVAQGRRYLASGLSEQLAADQSAQAPHRQLSSREFDVLRYLLQGLTVEEVSQRMSLSLKTVANYQTAIRQKLGVSTAVELLRYAREHGLEVA